MTEQQGRIASLLNSPNGQSYEVDFGQDATPAQLSFDSTPDAMIYVDDHEIGVLGSDSEMNVSLGPRGAQVSQSPMGSSGGPMPMPMPMPMNNAGGQAPSGQVPSGQPSNLAQGDPGSWSPSPSSAPGVATPSNYGTGSQSGWNPATTPGGSGSAAPAIMDSSGGHPGWHMTKGTIDNANGVSVPTDMPDDGEPELWHTEQDRDDKHGGGGMPPPIMGNGPNAAEANLNTSGLGKNFPKPVVTKNPDGSLDLAFPKGKGNPHDLKVNVPPGKNVDLNLSKDKNGNLQIKANPHQPGSGTPGSGLPGSGLPGSGIPGYPGSGTPGSGLPGSGLPGSGLPGSGTPGSGTPGSGLPGSGLPGSGTPGSGTPGTDLSGLPNPNIPKLPNAPSGANPSGANPSGANPSGANPSGNNPYGDPNDPNNPLNPNNPNSPYNPNNPNYKLPPGVSPSGYASIKQDSIKQLGADIDKGPTSVMDTAAKNAGNIDIGIPGFGVIGKVGGLSGAFNDVKSSAAAQFSDGHNSLSKWTPKLTKTATNWEGAEYQSNTDVTGVGNGE